MFLQSAFQFGILPSKPSLFPLKFVFKFVIHSGQPKFISLPVKFPANRSKFQFCTTIRSKLIIIFTRTVLLCGNKVGTFTMIFVRAAMSYMIYPRCGVCALVGVYPFLKNAVSGIRVRVSIRVRVRVNPNPKTPLF